jgi:5'-3' exonuclease
VIPAGLPSDGLLVAIDWSWWANVAYHAAGGVDGMLPILVGRFVELLRGESPSHLVVCVDSVGKTWRHDLYPEYKAGREPKPPEFFDACERALEIVRMHAVPVLDAEGYEADDVFAALVERATVDGLLVALLACDKDLAQLVAPDVCMWDGAAGVRWAGDVQEKWGVHPTQIPDFLAIVGDKGDNVPGVPKLGPVAAAAILGEYVTVEVAMDVPIPEVLDDKQVAALARKVKAGGAVQFDVDRARTARTRAGYLTKLQAAREQVLASKVLTTLRYDTPIAWDAQAAALGGYDVDALRAEYQALGWARLAADVRPCDKAPWRLPGEEG